MIPLQEKENFLVSVFGESKASINPNANQIYNISIKFDHLFYSLPWEKFSTKQDLENICNNHKDALNKYGINKVSQLLFVLNATRRVKICRDFLPRGDKCSRYVNDVLTNVSESIKKSHEILENANVNDNLRLIRNHNLKIKLKKLFKEKFEEGADSIADKNNLKERLTYATTKTYEHLGYLRIIEEIFWIAFNVMKITTSEKENHSFASARIVEKDEFINSLSHLCLDPSIDPLNPPCGYELIGVKPLNR